MRILALNSGSSSLKFGLYRVGPAEAEPLLCGAAESIGAPESNFHAEGADGRTLVRESLPLAGPREAMQRVFGLFEQRALPPPQAIGHRIVHGGPELREHCRIDAAVMTRLERALPFAPLHLPAELAIVRLAQAQFRDVPQAACFDTSFHARMPEVARVLPLPRAWRARGIERYGFHGLSCESIVRQLGGGIPERLVIAHLGSGASVTAVLHGRSIDTSMGMTPTGGLIMGTRSGDLDPGVLVYLAREGNLDAERLESLVDRESGLLGISGVSGDMQTLHAAATTDAALAIDMFCYGAAKQIAAMSVVLGGAQLLVFTGGIGEHDPDVRARICGRLGSIGVRPDGADASPCRVRVLPSEEDAEIARQANALYQ